MQKKTRQTDSTVEIEILTPADDVRPPVLASPADASSGCGAEFPQHVRCEHAHRELYANHFAPAEPSLREPATG